jgi:hypothetical protein
MKLTSLLSLVAMVAGLTAALALAGSAPALASFSLSLGMLMLPVSMGDVAHRRPLVTPDVRSERMALAA